jgi:Flp pilus assembly protein TadB
MPGPIGVGLAAAVGLGGPAVVTRLEPSSARRRRERITAQAPIIADVLAAAMATGVPLTVALDTVAAAVGCPGGDVLAATSRSLALGSDRAWTALAAEESLRPIGEALSRASRTGAPLADVLANIADDLRRRHVGAVEVAARAAGVRAILPLATCFLPAFLLLGVVPVVAALAAPYFAR